MGVLNPYKIPSQSLSKWVICSFINRVSCVSAVLSSALVPSHKCGSDPWNTVFMSPAEGIKPSLKFGSI